MFKIGDIAYLWIQSENRLPLPQESPSGYFWGWNERTPECMPIILEAWEYNGVAMGFCHEAYGIVSDISHWMPVYLPQAPIDERVKKAALSKMKMKMYKIFNVTYFQNLHGRDKKFSHKNSEKWEVTEYFCPAYGKEAVWFRNDSSDYYVGEQYICINCQSTFYLPGGVLEIKDEQDKQRLNQLKEVINPTE